MRIVATLVASALLSTGCVPRATVIPDPTVPHQVASEAEIEIWTRLPDGRLAPTKVRLLQGWWIAGPPVVEAAP